MITCFSCLPLFDFTCSLSLRDSDFCSWRISYKIITVMMEGVINLYCHGFINLIKICCTVVSSDTFPAADVQQKCTNIKKEKLWKNEVKEKV